MKRNKKRTLKGIANGLICSFVSRNNDVYGYWGIGKLCSLILSVEPMIIEVDLIDKGMMPFDSEFNLLISEFSNRLLRDLKKFKLSIDSLNEVKIILKCYPDDAIPEYRKIAPHRMNCSIEIIDKFNVKQTISKNVWCREHNTESESKSTRKY